MDLLLDMFMAFFGSYLMYAAVNMKRTGEIAKGVIVGKNVDLAKATDIPGFIRYMYGKTLAIGFCALVCGLVGVYNDLYGGLLMLQLIMAVFFFAVVIVFGFFMVKAQKKFLGQ